MSRMLAASGVVGVVGVVEVTRCSSLGVMGFCTRGVGVVGFGTRGWLALAVDRRRSSCMRRLT